MGKHCGCRAFPDRVRRGPDGKLHPAWRIGATGRVSVWRRQVPVQKSGHPRPDFRDMTEKQVAAVRLLDKVRPGDAFGKISANSHRVDAIVAGMNHQSGRLYGRKVIGGSGVDGGTFVCQAPGPKLSLIHISEPTRPY